MNLVLFVLPVFNGGHIETCLIWKQQSSGFLHVCVCVCVCVCVYCHTTSTRLGPMTPHQPLVSGKDDSIQHGLIEETVTHPF